MSAGRLDSLLYAQSWEDPDVLRGGLAVGPDDHVLSVTASGDNTFALLLDDPRSVTAIDRNTAQTHLMQLKLAMLRTLGREEALELLGEHPSSRRRELFARINPHMPEASRAFWQRAEPQRWLQQGVVTAGRFERYMRMFGRFVMPLIHDRATVERMLGLGDTEEQRAFYDRVWDSRRWRALFRVFFSPSVMKRLGRDPSFFAHVAVDAVSDRFRRRAERTLTELPVRDNPYLGWILTGEHRATRLLPPYLRPGSYETVAARLDRVRVLQGDLLHHLRAVPARSYSAFNLSDLFEYLSESETEELFRALVRSARPGARLLYWNLLVPRSRPASLSERVVGDDETARALFAGDRVPFYERLVLERVLDDGPGPRAGEASAEDGDS